MVSAISGGGAEDDFSFSYYDYITTDGCSGFGWNFANFTDLEQKFVGRLLNNAELTVLALFLQPLFAVIGILANFSFIFIVRRVPYMRNNMNTLLLNLAVADLTFLSIGSVEEFIKVLSSPFIGDDSVIGKVAGCWILAPLLDLTSIASLLLISLLSVERFYAICRPLQHLKVSSPRRTRMYLCVVWLISLVFAGCLFPTHNDLSVYCVLWPNGEQYKNYPAVYGQCVSPSLGWVVMGQILQLVPYFIALFFNVVCYARIIHTLYYRVSREATEAERARRQRNSANAATRMILVNGVAFFVLTSPFYIIDAINFLQVVYPKWMLNVDVKYLAIVLLYINSAVNPFIYGFTNPTYRQAYAVVFCGSKCLPVLRSTDRNNSGVPHTRPAHADKTTSC